MTTPVLDLAELVASQSQPHLPINENSRTLEQFANVVRVLSQVATAPPSPVVDGEAYILPSGHSFPVGNENDIVYAKGGGWVAIPPKSGWLAYVVDEDTRYSFSATSPGAWVEFTTGGGGGASLTIDDGVTTVTDVTTILLVNAVVSEVTGGVAMVTAAGGSGGGGGTGGNVTPDTHPAVPNAMDDEFEDTVLDTGLWTWNNQGSATASLAAGSLILTAPAAASDSLRCIEQTVSGAGKWRGKFAGVNTANTNLGGIGFRNSSNGKLITLNVSRAASTISADNWNSVSSFNSGIASAVSRDTYAGPVARGWLYAELEYDGTNIIGRFSHVGLPGTFEQFFSVAAATFLGTPDRVLLMASSNNASVAGVLYCDWFRKVA